MADLYGTIFECDGKKAIRHRVREQDIHTKCGIDMYNKRGSRLNDCWSIEHELPKEIRCKKCYPTTRKAKRWLTSSKKK